MKFAKLSNTSDKLKNWFNTLPWNNRGFVILLLFLTYFLFTGIRFILFSLAQEPLIQADELIYKGMAYSFFETGDFYKLNYGSKYIHTTRANCTIWLRRDCTRRTENL